MCTVTYLPTGENSFILTSNRDENRGRAAYMPTKVDTELGYQLLFPQDPKSGGTWICADDQDRLLCILNGAFENHKRILPYRRSRGLVVLDFFTYPDAQSFLKDYDFDNIEPFTLVIYDKQTLHELRWDGKEKHIKELATTQPYIWSSATLYSESLRQKRRTWFNQWLPTQEGFTVAEALDFHQFGGEKNEEYGFVMNRWGGLVETVSITSIHKQEQQVDMVYKDLVNNTLTNKKLALTEAVLG